MMTLLLALSLLAQDAPKPEVIQLWPGQAPGEPGPGGEDKMEKGGVVNVTRPTIAVYHPAKDKNSGAAVVVAPGGGYRMLAITHEGTDVAAWLTSAGITAVLLRYRVPRRPDDAEDKLPLQDAQRAMSLTRSKAAEWGVDPARIGFMGFSAGGHLTANVSTNYDRRAYDAVDDADKASCRPDFAVLIYPGGILDKQDKEKLRDQIRVTKDTPPSFLAVATDDQGSAPGTVRLYLALRAAGVPAELHIYGAGGHGFGMRKMDKPCASWPQRCEEWMRSRGLLTAAAGGK
ncbi:MAG: alpha/beta hydrolase [Planctomycetes bacterium]|nr:alpha/beta hydrolase [Planctomycetota bacterium]